MNGDSASLPRTFAVLERGRVERLHTGAQLYISRSGQVVADAAFGENHPGESMSAETIMLWRSLTKPLTAIAIAMLVERGSMTLSDTVASHIPEFACHGKEGITIEHLLTHTAGMRSADLLLSEDMDWETALEAIIHSRPEPGAVPGKQAGYHMSSTWYLLGELIRRSDGRDCGRFVRDEIFLPLGMHDSWIGMDEGRFREYGHRVGMMFERKGDTLIPHPFANSEMACALCQPGSNGRGPIRELGLFYENLLATGWGNNIASKLPLSAETARAWTSRQRLGMMDRTFRHTIDWGYGFIIDSNRYGKETVPYGYGRHGGEETFGHSGSQSSCAFADPARELVVAWVCNGMPGEAAHQKRARDLNSAVYEDLGLAGTWS